MTPQIGFFGVPGRSDRSTKVHAAVNGKPICGSVLASDQEFQWCATGCSFLHLLECKSCIKVIQKKGREVLDALPTLWWHYRSRD